MKKALGILLVLALIATVFVACSQDAGQKTAEELVSVSFDGSKARGLTPSRDPFDADEYVWTYTAQKADTTGLTTGETTEQKRINDGKGLSGKVPGFSQGYWNFTLYAYEAEEYPEGTGKYRPVPDSDPLYSGTASHVKVAKGDENVITVSVSPATTGNGYIAFDKAHLFLNAIKTGEDINAQGDERSANFEYGIYAINDTTFSTNLFHEVDGKTILTAGSYFVRVSYRVAGDGQDRFDIADEAIVAVVYGGQTTTITGSIGELSTDVSFGANEVEIPSAEGTAVAVPADMKKTETYDQYKTRTGHDVDPVTLKNAETETASTVIATVPKEAVYSLLQESISDDPNTTSNMSLDLTVDINTQETTASKKAYEINLIKTVETTTTTTTGTSKSTNASLVKNVAEYVAAIIKVGAGLRDVEVYHSDVLMKEVTAAQYVGDVSTLDEGAGVYYYDSTAGVLYLKTKSFSPFVVTFTPDTIPVTAKVMNATRGVGYADLKAAIEAAAAGETLRLVADVEIPATATGVVDRIVVNKDITIDFGTYKLIAPGVLEPTDNWVALRITGDVVFEGTTGGIDCLDNGNDCGPYAVYVEEGGSLVVNGGVYHGGGTAFQVRKGALYINGGTVYVTDFADPDYAGYKYVINCIDAQFISGEAIVAIKGGSFGHFNPADAHGEPTNPTSYVVAGYVSTYDSSTGYYSVVPAVAKVGNVYFASLKDAFDAIGTEEGTIELLADIEVSEYVRSTEYCERLCYVDNLYYGQTLNGNGHTITMKGQTEQAVLIGNMYGTIKNLVVEGMNGPLSGDGYMGAVYENITVKGGWDVDGNEGGFVTYVWSGTGSDLTLNSCVSELNLNGFGGSADYNAAFIGYMVYKDYNIYFNNCINKGNVICGSAGMFLGNVRTYTGSIYITNCRNDGTIQRTYVPEEQYRHNQMLYGTTSDWNATTYIDGVKYTMAQVNAREADDAIPGNRLILGPEDDGLTLTKNNNNRLVFTPINNDNVDYYVVSSGLYVDTGSGSGRFYVTHRINASEVGDSYISIEDLSYVDNTWLTNHSSEASVAPAPFNNEVMIVTFGTSRYYLVTNEAWSTNGSHSVAPAELWAVSAFDAAGNLLGSTGF